MVRHAIYNAFLNTSTVGTPFLCDPAVFNNWNGIPRVPLEKTPAPRSSFAPSYLSPFTYVADLPSRRRLRSSCSDCFVQPSVHRSTVGSRAFSVAVPQVLNCLLPEVTSAPFLATFRTRLKTFLFTDSHPDIRLSDISVSTHCL